MPDESSKIDVLDARQLNQIEATHRGFLYQHLFAVGCLLKGSQTSIETVIVEHDEDLELIAGDRHIYAQIKLRSGTLYDSQLDGFFSRAQKLREMHANQSRTGTAEIWLISNAPLSAELASRLAADEIGVWSPQSTSRIELLFPPPHADVVANFEWCVEAASRVALTRLSPETLVWKLAAVIAYRSAGLDGGHAIHTTQLSHLFELFAAQLHHFPESPTSYRQQQGEPELQGEEQVLLVVSISGSGKTAWASYSALHSGATIIYFDGAEVPDAAVASALLRETVAQMGAKSGIAGNNLIPPGASGLEGLRAVELAARRASVRPVIVFDNVHAVAPQTVKTIVSAMGSCRWVLLGQPSPRSNELKALLDTDAVGLNGWSLLAIAAEFESAGAPLDPATADRVRQLSGGIPRFVVNAGVLTARFYGGDAKAFCEAVETSANTTRTAQELILQATFTHLSANARLAIALLSLARLSLSEAECLDFLSVRDTFCSKAVAVKAVAELQDWGVVQRLLSGAIITHDAFFVLANALFEELNPEDRMAAMKKLASVLQRSFGPAVRTPHVVLPPSVKNRPSQELADIASSLSEHIHEQGRTGDLELVLEDVLASNDVAPIDRFMVADTLALWALHQPDKTGFPRLVRTMEQLAHDHNLGCDSNARLLMKQTIEAALDRDLNRIEVLGEQALAAADTPLLRRIAKYNLAVSFYICDEPSETVAITAKLIEEYYEALGLTLEMVFASSPKALADDLGHSPDTMDDLKRLGDVLDLRARVNDLGRESVLCRLHAMKFYQIAHVPVSLMKVGQDVVDECVRILHDPVEARRVIETLLLPIVEEYRLSDYVVPVRGQYAVVLAHCGEMEAARHLITQLKKFAVSDGHAAQLQVQAELIENIAIEKRMVSRAQLRSKFPKVGRNDLCPCGSGRKYKRCHGG